MSRNTEAYTSTHQAEYPQEDSPELTDWQKQQAAERFLENLEAHDHQLAHDIKQASQDPEYRPSWLSARKNDLDHHYNALRSAMEPLQHDEREYVAAETASALYGKIPEQAANYAAQPATHLLEGQEPPEYYLGFDPDGYNAVMEHFQKDLAHQVTYAQQAIHQGLAKPDRYDFTDAIEKLQQINHNLRSLETGEPITLMAFQDRRNREGYLSAMDARTQEIMDEYSKSITADYPELAPRENPLTANRLLTEPALQDKFRWFTQGYELLPTDIHQLAYAIHSQAVQETEPQNQQEKIKTSLRLRQFRDQLLQ